jgi:serine/threonine-protein kinase
MIGETLSHYRIHAKLGEGGMGVVYRAQDDRLGREVALKVLPPGALADQTAQARLLREARAASALNHPNICTIYDIGEAGGRFFIAMEYIHGQPLSALVATGALPLEMVVRYGAQIADALAHAHERGIVHRDLKSSNVVITPEGRAKVLDFGLAKRLAGPELDQTTRSMDPLTQAGTVVGTLHYMAPELLRGAQADARSDIWALGVVLYELASGKLPFTGTTGYELSSAILRDPPAPLPARAPAGLRTSVQTCLAKEPGQRYQRAGEVRAALEALSLGLAVTPAPPARRPVTAAAPKVRRGQIRSLAVLPLTNLSSDPAQEYLAEGLTEVLLTDLAQISALRVISRTSSGQYKGVRKPLPEIARELNVDAIVEGSVQRSGDRVRITAQLIEAPTDRHLWAKSYERDLGDLLALESEVAQAIAGEIRIKLTPRERVRLARVRPVHREAHEVYLKEIYHFDRLDLPTGMNYFQQAIKLDPDYAPAYGRLARGYYYYGFFGVLPPKEAFSKLKETAATALQKDNALAEAYGYRALAHLYYDWDWAEADRGLRRALELKPSHAELSHAYGHYLMVMGRTEEGLAECKRAVELDPVGVILTACLGWHCLFSREYDEAVEPLLKALRMDPNLHWTHVILGWTYEQKGMFEQAITEYRDAISFSGGLVIAVAALGHALAVSGKRSEAHQVLAQLAERAQQSYVSAYDVATIYTGLGDREKAFEWLQKAYEEHSSFLIHIPWDPRFDTLHADPRYHDLLARVGLPPLAPAS